MCWKERRPVVSVPGVGRDHAASSLVSKSGETRPRDAKGPPQSIQSSSASSCLGLGFQEDGRVLLSLQGEGVPTWGLCCLLWPLGNANGRKLCKEARLEMLTGVSARCYIKIAGGGLPAPCPKKVQVPRPLVG